MRTKTKAVVAAAAASLALTGVCHAGGVTYRDGDKQVKFGGRIQLQYHATSPDAGGGDDTLFLRRFRPYIEGTVHPGWNGKFQWDMGKAEDDNEIAVKDAYVRYTGFRNVKVTIGNAKQTFSREQLTSSKKQQLIERTFVGDHNYGSPDRSLGLHVTGHTDDKKIEWATTVSEADIDPDNKKLDFDTPVNADADFNQGWLVGGRVDYHPFGHLKKSQGDFKRERRATIGVAAFTWANDKDNAPSPSAPVKADVDTVTGFEISGAFRGAGFSVDAEYNRFDADTIDPTVTGGLYTNGSTTLESYAVEGGYMMVPDTLELVAGYQAQDADGYADTWTRTSVGANWFIEKHDIKLQFTYRIGQNLDGTAGNDEDEAFLQAQYVF